MNFRTGVGCVLAASLICVPVVPVLAQVTTNSTTTPLGRALMAERNGAYGDAATQYAAILRDAPANLGALTGMTHILPRLDRRATLDSLIHAALLADSTSTGVLGIAVANFAATGHADSARKYTLRWSARDPGDDEPFREWSEAALQARDVLQARQALDLGREKLGNGALGVERAEMLQRSGDFSGATAEWIAVVHANPPFRDGAVGVLVAVPVNQRAAVRATLTKDGSREARQMLGLLLTQWGEPADGAAMVRTALPDDALAAAALLQTLIDDLRGREDKASRQASASIGELLAAREPPANRSGILMDAARAYADAGDESDARRVLALVAGTSGAPANMATAASTTLLGVLIAEGKPGDAERVLTELGNRVDPDEHDRLARRIAMAWARAGNLARAETLVAADSSIQGFDLRGRLALYQGDLAGANDLLKQAGPFDDPREQALRRITLLVLIQAVGRDSSRALGDALLQLERGDSARAVSALASIAGTFNAGGAAETRLLGGQVALAIGDTVAALRLLQQADVRVAPATSAASRMEQARIGVASGRVGDARTLLEHLIIDYPESAVVPEARRLRDSLASPVAAGGR